jgi:DMSO/TMAO reductase YedYZ molybdopterin-dependent catalytic subunit
MHDTNKKLTTGDVTPAVSAAPTPATYTRWRTFLISTLLAPGAGLAASLLAAALMGALRLMAGIPTPVELFGDFVLKHIDAGKFVWFQIVFSPNSKTVPLGLALLGMIALGVVLSLLYAAIVRVPLPTRGYQSERREWLTALAFALAMTLVGVLLFWDELAQNGYGLPLGWAALVAALGLLTDFGLYALVLCLAYRALLPKRVEASSPVTVQKRRQLLSRVGVAALTVGGAGGTLAAVRGYLNNYTSYDGIKYYPPGDVTAPITPNDAHYVVTQNAVDPSTDIVLWQLEITGLVHNPGLYTYAEVQNLPSTSRAITLECIANGIGDHLLSTAIWHGVTLRTLLEKHGGALPNARYVAFYSVDGYSISLPLEEVLAVDALLAWRMNGAELPHRHGYPMRVLIPGRFGEENPKWLTRVELTDHFVGGLYADQGWYNGPLHTISRIDRPHRDSHVPSGQTIEVGGVAFAGNRGIQKVEISTDAGSTWQEATLQPALSQDSWVLWTWQWKVSAPGKYTLVCRATDGTGAVQTSQVQGTVPNGATGYHKINIVAD